MYVFGEKHCIMFNANKLFVVFVVILAFGYFVVKLYESN